MNIKLRDSEDTRLEIESCYFDTRREAEVWLEGVQRIIVGIWPSVVEEKKQVKK